MLGGLIFDVDGTLAETEELHRRAFNEAFAAEGLPWHWTRHAYHDLLKVTGGKERIRHFIETADPPGGSDASARIPSIHATKTRLYNAHVERGMLALRPGIEALVRSARTAGLRLAIATTTSHPNVESLLTATLGPHGPALFDAVCAGDDVPAKKPDPGVYLLALERLGLPAHRCLAFEDSANGLAAARAAGIATVVTPSRYTMQEDFTGALCVLESLERLPPGLVPLTPGTR